MSRRRPLFQRLRAVSLFFLLFGALLLVLPGLGTAQDAGAPEADAPAGVVDPGDGDDAATGTAGPEATGDDTEEGVEAVPPPGARPRVLRADLDGVVNPGSASYLQALVVEGAAGGYDAVLLVIDTPGGLLDSTREISRDFFNADVPVIVFVYPTGARAASAGMFITMSGHVAAMAPGTRIGAAAPVALGGGGEEGEGQAGMDEKVIEDTAAFARGVAEQRGKNAEWAEKAVREAVSATASEALELGAIDLVSPSVDALLREVDGRTVLLHDGREVTLRTAEAEVVLLQMTIQQRVLMVLGDPNVAYILMMLGLLGLMMELYNPGLIFPAAIGLFCLLLAGIGFNILPVNVGGIVLLVIAVALIVAEFYVTSFGILAAAGVGVLILGSMLLMDTADPDFYVDPSIQVSWGVIIPTVLLMAGVAIGLMIFIMRTHRRRGTTGEEGLLGERGTARTEIGPGGGRVFVHGELWKAVSDATIPKDAEVEVVAVEGLLLKVAERSTA
jgi:membrane-bound serine protease (ClpP class)